MTNYRLKVTTKDINRICYKFLQVRKTTLQIAYNMPVITSLEESDHLDLHCKLNRKLPHASSQYILTILHQHGYDVKQKTGTGIL